MLLDVSLESQTIPLAVCGTINTIGLGGFTGDLFIPSYATRIMLKMQRVFFLQNNAEQEPEGV